MRYSAKVVDQFAGPGGWSLACKRLGLDELGIEWDDAACATREAAGLRTLQADVSLLDPHDFEFEGLISSPPCQAYSAAGKRGGEQDREIVEAVADDLAIGRDRRADAIEECEDPRSLLVVEPLRWALVKRPAWIACEQVPPVLDLWRKFAQLLEGVGYRTWAGILTAEMYGVPQTRQRAFLVARLDREVGPPSPTHRRYIAPRKKSGDEALGLFEMDSERIERPEDSHLLPWISMAEALGWDGEDLPTAEKVMGRGMVERHGERPGRDASEPAFTIRASAGGNEPGGFRWSMRANKQTNAAVRGIDEPAPTIKGGHDYNDRQWIPQPGDVLRTGQNTVRAAGADVYERDVALPAPTLTGNAGRSWRVHTSRDGGKQVRPDTEPAPTVAGVSSQWTRERPATTIACDSRVFQPGGHHTPGAQSENAIRVVEWEAAVLQSFPADYPWQGTKSKRFEQIGNAVPPLLAERVLEAVIS